MPVRTNASIRTAVGKMELNRCLHETNIFMPDTEKCIPAFDGCTGLTGTNSACLSAGSTCASATETPIEVRDS